MEQNKKICRSCGKELNENVCHCTNCLASIHEQDSEGYECGGTLQAIAVLINDDDSWEIIKKCSLCNELISEPAHELDNPLKLLSIASRPLANPPFPIEKLEELNDISGCIGSLRGYYNE